MPGPRALVRRAFAHLDARGRARPAFLILGAQRAGTTTLYKLLTMHPSVFPPTKKEIHFFDLGFHRGRPWYLRHFPTKREMRGAPHALTGESTPYYLFHPHAPRRVASALPRARLLVLLRDPVERAWSHYQHERANGRESRPFALAVEEELRDLPAECRRLEADPAAYSESHHRHSYLHRGIYADQLERWFRAVPRDRFLVLESGDLFAAPEQVYSRVLEFLGLPPFRPDGFGRFGTRGRDAIPPAEAARLADFFAPHDLRLGAILGREPGWSAR